MRDTAKTILKDFLFKDAWFYIFGIASIGLLIASFVVPPVGIISSSVLAGVGELFAFATLGTVIHAIDKGLDAKVQHGNTTVTVGDLNKDKEEE